MTDYSLVYQIVRDHFQKEDYRMRHIQNCKHLNEYFYENCSVDDILSLEYEKTKDGLYEVFKHTAYHLLSKYGLHVYSIPNSWNNIGREFRYRRTIDALTLPDSNVIIDHYNISNF